MPTMRMNVDVKQKGMVFSSAKSKAAASRMIIQINDAIAQEGVDRVLTVLGNVLQNPTGYYESKIAVERRSVYRGVTDNNVIYGGYLEGVSSLNKRTRFKGYHTFRQVKQQLDRDKVKIAKPIVDKFIREMNS